MGGECYRGGEGARPHRAVSDKDAQSDPERGDQFRNHPDHIRRHADHFGSHPDHLSSHPDHLFSHSDQFRCDRMIFSVNRMSPELIQISSKVIRISWEVKSRDGDGQYRGGARWGVMGAGCRNTSMGVPAGSADDDQSVVPGLGAGLRVRLNSCFISFTNSSTPALGEATLAKAYTSSAC